MFGNSAIDLMSQRAPALVRDGDDLRPLRGDFRIERLGTPRRHYDLSARAARKGVVARRHAACHLDIDDAVVHPIAPEHLAHHGLERRVRHRLRDLELGERAVEALQMQALVDEATPVDGDHLVDAVRELVAAVVDVDRRIPMREVAAVHVGDARHQPARSSSRGLTSSPP
jgi:hypothetical protein